MDKHIPSQATYAGSNQAVRVHAKAFCLTRRRKIKRLFGIDQTTTMNALIVDRYLEYALENIGKVPVEDLLPWSEKLPKRLSIMRYRE